MPVLNMGVFLYETYMIVNIKQGLFEEKDDGKLRWDYSKLS